MAEKFMKVVNVSKIFKSGNNETKALDNVSFDIEKGEFAIILGPSGAGKSTILNLLGGMDNVTKGNIFINDIDIAKYNNKQLTDYRRNNVGFIFQFYNLMPNLTAKENVELAVEICKNAFKPDDILQKVGLTERAAHFPSQLSGGEQQRVSIARAIAKNPDLLLCDEPTGALDYNTGKTILKLLHDLSRSENKTVIIVTHNSALKDMADKVIRIKNGQILSVNKNDNPKDISEIEW